ncbi:MAG: transglycosylase domain-containing protein [Tepidiformaceae bacterium]
MNALQKRRLLNTRRTRRKKGIPWWLTGLLALAVLGSLSAVAGVGALMVTYQVYAEDYVPIEDKLRQTNVGLTEIYDRNGVELGALTNPDAQLLQPVPLDQISQAMIDATISTEDNEFWDHPGVNVIGLARAGWEYINERETGGGTGGSSITQQLIKNVYICPSIGEGSRDCVAERTVKRKLKEIAYAIELEQDYSKEDILTWYLNQISYADRYIGVQAAAEGYFHKNASELTLAEAALLAGIPQFPTTYHPRLNCVKDENGVDIVVGGRCEVGGAAKARMEDVLDLMVDHDRATQAEVDAAKAEPVRVYVAGNPLKAEAFIDNQVEPRLVRMCEKGQLPLPKEAEDCTKWVHAAGWQVKTTLDWQATDDAMRMLRGFIETGLSNGCECNNGAIATIDPRNGQIMIYAPNRDPSYVSDLRVSGKIDQLNEVNQPGSSFKPAVYLAWFDNLNKHPYSTFWDTSPLTIEGVAITNPRTGGPTEGMISARAGLGGSQNVPAFRAASEVGADGVIAMAKQLGITTLDQHFDPTFVAHEVVTYGASIATGGANIRAIDMAYMDTVIANMGVMVGLPHYADYVELGDLKGTFTHEGEDWELANEQKLAFERGHIRIAGSRELDPVVILEIKDKDGNLVWEMTDDKLVRQEVVNPGSVWLLHSIMSDCNARFIIWNCGGSNNDLALESFDLDGVQIPTGVKTGTQQGPLSASDTLETWMTGYSRYAGTAVWVGNATNELVNDRRFAAANTTVRLFKNWMGTYHSLMKSKGLIPAEYEGFASLQPPNVARKEVESVTTDRRPDGLKGGCDQKVTGWVRTDVTYESECEEKEIDVRNGLLASENTPAQYRAMRKFVKLPAFKPDLAIALAKSRNIPIAPTEKSTGQSPLSITNLSTGKRITSTTVVVGQVNISGDSAWRLEIGKGAAPSEWTQIGSGSGSQNGQLGIIDIGPLETGPYTVRLVLDSPSTPLSVSVTINVRKTPGQGDDDDPEAEATRPPTTFPTPTGD